MPDDPTKIDARFDPEKRRISGRTAHGNMYFDVPFVSHVKGNLWTGGCEDGLVLPVRFDHLISLYPWEAYKVQHTLKSFTAVKLYDAELDDHEALNGLAEWAAACVKSGPTLIHCQAGLNRSALVAAMVLVKQDLSPRAAIDLLRQKRSHAVLCNRYFEEFLLTGEPV